jgi:SAM-dependent methyltransferase
LSFTFPSPTNADGIPEWTGHGFRVGNQLLPVLEYSENFGGWSDDLTLLHEETLGDSHPIDRASRGDALNQLKAQLREPAPSILEIGCSSGFLIKEMSRAFPAALIIGADVVREPLYKLANDLPSIPLLRFDLLQCPLPSDSFDAVVMLNVLEHIKDDRGALAQVHRILRPGGVIVVEVPAGPHLFDAYDKALMHFRRYRSAELADKLRHVGFDVVRRSHLGFFLYPAFSMVKRRNQRKAVAKEDLNGFVQTQAAKTSASPLLRWVVAVERMLGKWIDFPIGIRCLAVGKKMVKHT